MLISCQLKENDSKIIIEKNLDLSDSLKLLFLENSNKISTICDSLIEANNKDFSRKEIWISSTIAYTKYAPNILGKIAEKTLPYSEEVIMEVTVFKNKSIKNLVLITTDDSIINNKLKTINFKTDSTQNFIFGIDSL
jgi:hypothetical protein